ncbi:hypothetical protein ABIC28_000430 [Rhodococcus sp. PvR044]
MGYIHHPECTDETKAILSYAKLIVFGVTTSIAICFTVYDLPTSDAEVIAQLFEEVLKETQLDSDTIIALRDSEDGTRRDVRVFSEDWVGFSGFYRWRPPFEESLQRRVTEAVPHAKVSFEWDYRDEDQ